MKRREFLKKSGTVAGLLGLTNLGYSSTTNSPIPTSPSRVRACSLEGVSEFFNFSDNSLANPDQIAFEKQALQLSSSDRYQNKLREVESRWRFAVGSDVSEEAWLNFSEFVNEFCFHYLLKAINSDTNYPRVLSLLYGPPHSWAGMNIPGSRPGGGDNVDSTYTHIPIDGKAKYELSIRTYEPAPVDMPITIAGDLAGWIPLNQLNARKRNADGIEEFKITIGPESIKGTHGHLKSTLDTKLLFTRDTRSDWLQKIPAYCIKRLDSPDAMPITEEQILARFEQYVIEYIPINYYWVSVMNRLPLNQVPRILNIASHGGLAGQALATMHTKIQDDEAFVITISPSGAKYFSIILYDFWFRSLDHWNHISSFNNSQSWPNADGTTTYVISQEDPGIHNWLDPVGLREHLLLHRWQVLPDKSDTATELPWITGNHIKLKDLEKWLPPDIKRITSEERTSQLIERKRTFAARFRV